MTAAERREELAREEQNRQRARVVRERLREKLQELDGPGRQRLLAAVGRHIAQAGRTD